MMHRRSMQPHATHMYATNMYKYALHADAEAWLVARPGSDVLGAVQDRQRAACRSARDQHLCLCVRNTLAQTHC